MAALGAWRVVSNYRNIFNVTANNVMTTALTYHHLFKLIDVVIRTCDHAATVFKKLCTAHLSATNWQNSEHPILLHQDFVH